MILAESGSCARPQAATLLTKRPPRNCDTPLLRIRLCSALLHAVFEWLRCGRRYDAPGLQTYGSEIRPRRSRRALSHRRLDPRQMAEGGKRGHQRGRGVARGTPGPLSHLVLCRCHLLLIVARGHHVSSMVSGMVFGPLRTARGCQGGRQWPELSAQASANGGPGLSIWSPTDEVVKRAMNRGFVQRAHCWRTLSNS